LKAKKCLYPLRFASDFPKAPFQKEAKKGNHFEDAGIYMYMYTLSPQKEPTGFDFLTDCVLQCFLFMFAFKNNVLIISHLKTLDV